MKASAMGMLSLLLLGLVAPVGWAQEKPKTDEKPGVEAQTTPVKVLILFTEFEGEKKVKSLPYTLYINAANSPEQKPGWTRLRIGNRVPVYTGNNSFSYFDVGTNIDARAAYAGDGRFLLNLNLERSSVEGSVLVPMQKPSETNVQETQSGSFRDEPIVHQFKSELDLKIREGQTVESTMATDPVSGKVLKVEVTISVVK